MKKFLEWVMEWKILTCFSFTGFSLMYIICALAMGERTVEIKSLLSILLIACVGCLFQFVCFSDNVIKRMRYSARLLLFAAVFLPTVIGAALLFQWFPPQSGLSWILFISIFVIGFVVITLGFEIYFRMTGKKYDGLLGQYKKEREETKA